MADEERLSGTEKSRQGTIGVVESWGADVVRGKVVACDPTYLLVACDPTYLVG